MSLRRYHATFPADLYDEMERAASRRSLTVLTLIRSSVRLGLIAMAIEAETGAVDLVGGDGVARRLVLP